MCSTVVLDVTVGSVIAGVVGGGANVKHGDQLGAPFVPRFVRPVVLDGAPRLSPPHRDGPRALHLEHAKHEHRAERPQQVQDPDELWRDVEGGDTSRSHAHVSTAPTQR